MIARLAAEALLAGESLPAERDPHARYAAEAAVADRVTHHSFRPAAGLADLSGGQPVPLRDG
ncbi:MAG: hypothetical protein M3Z25_04815 [Actinomycetota bacterium]|nr:hypothetical protein [Actinomycetota bacterium]